MSAATDDRLIAARNRVASGFASDELVGLLAFAEERMRINVGLVQENAGLRAKLRQPEALDLTTIPTQDLFDELMRRSE